MKFSDHVIEVTSEQYRREMGHHPAFAALKEGRLRRESYVAYLRETYHLVRHTTSVLARAASYLPDAQRALRGWFIEQAIDEHNHDLLCMKDLEALGEVPHEVLSRPPGLGAWSLISQRYHLAQSDPVSLLGYMLTTEGIGATFAATAADVLTSGLYGYQSNQVTFLRAHGNFDIKHAEEVKKMMDELAEDARTRDAVLAVRRFSITYYARMLKDALDVSSADRTGPAIGSLGT